MAFFAKGIFTSPRAHALHAFTASRGLCSVGYLASNLSANSSAYSRAHNTSVLFLCFSMRDSSGCKQSLSRLYNILFISIRLHLPENICDTNDIINNHSQRSSALGYMSHNARRLGEVADRARHDLSYHKG